VIYTRHYNKNIIMKLLELFSGTGSVGKIAKEYGYTEIVSLDNDPRRDVTYCVDVLTWDYKVYPTGYFDVVWASPPCTAYSSMQYIVQKQRENIGKPYCIEESRRESDRIVERVLEIIKYYAPDVWFIENPKSGALKSRTPMIGLPYIDADYCKYGYPYRKSTRFWTNRQVSLMTCKYDCDYTDLGSRRHLFNIGIGGNRDMLGSLGWKYNLDMKYSIPPDLVRALLPRSGQCMYGTPV
jgi:site-specific DNA-cytosine methylase